MKLCTAFLLRLLFKTLKSYLFAVSWDDKLRCNEVARLYWGHYRDPTRKIAIEIE